MPWDKNAKRLAWQVVKAAETTYPGDTPQGLESLVEALRELMRAFPGKPRSWYFRAVYRVLRKTVKRRRGYWLVEGLPELGDTKPAYIVVQDRAGRYNCSCYTGLYGALRAKHVCTHIAAVMLYRRQMKIMEF